MDTTLKSALLEAERLAGVCRSDHYNVVRYELGTSCISLLYYPNFFEEPFPALRESWRVDLAAGKLSYRTYKDSLNPPILHRKELLISDDHPRWCQYKSLTEAAESVGLFAEPTRIGYQRQWLQLVREKGYQIIGHELVPIGNDESLQDDEAPLHADWSVARQLTALTRYGLSAPIQSLARYGFLDGCNTIFDYGCGRGDDVRGLVENGLQAAGWDPYYAPDNPITQADIVNLGFVINVIEDFDERVDALVTAFSLARQLLVVSVMLVNQNKIQGQRFKDGMLTKRGTFQKYYTQAEIRDFLEDLLHEEPIPVAPGVFFVFRDKDAEQRFLVNRFRSRGNVLRVPLLFPRERQLRNRNERTDKKYAYYRESLDRLWNLWVSLGRKPDKTEVEGQVALIEGFGSLNNAFRFIKARKNLTALECSRQTRTADLEVYFALCEFKRRKPYKRLEHGLQRDIKAFFGSYTNVKQVAHELLFQIADVEAINQACQQASEQGLGWLVERKSLQLHASLVEKLSPLLRVYVGCATVIYGDYHDADLVKIHIASGKVSFMKYDDFERKPLPRMTERVKVKLREQDIEYYAYDDNYTPPFLYNKSRYINEEFLHYPEQVVFDQALEKCGLFDFAGYGPNPDNFLEILSRNRLVIEGFRLVRSRTIPNLDSPCGRYFIFRQLIECGETQARTGLENLPEQPETYNALCDLTTQVLDPVIDYFGMIRLTYGFCSPALAKKIPGRISPQRDQHAACELNRRGKPICDRLGAAVDFIVDYESMLEVAQWVVANTPFDRLYFYGDDKPIHVSFGPDNSKQIVRMILGKSGKLLPQVTPMEAFLSLE
ncbi:DNA phosphorothioation-associated putative methyltransferase [Nitrosococcus halophilus]|nr:DNA phosphorothioation-associated putative methyltransferase [Nitrosococcus halophilus]